MRDWKPGDIFEILCPWCNEGKVEFFKDEPRRKCPECGKPVKNPRIDMGCLEWCPFAKECVGVQKDADKTE
jgi:uncharacterized protein (DUF983 family)